jgi:hypothetical protein
MLSVFSILSLGCGGSTSSNGGGNSGRVPASIEVVSGNSQTGFALEELTAAIVVRVIDSSGAPVAGQPISFRVMVGGGSVSVGTSSSDTSGVASERWTLGAVNGLAPVPQSLEAQVGGTVLRVAIQATALARPPKELSYATNPATYAVGTPIPPNAPSSTGGPVASYSVAPELPQGLALSQATGVVSGSPAAVSSATTYVVTAANSGGSTTASLSITVGPPTAPIITGQPTDTSVFVGETATFRVVATGDGSLGYQWKKNGTPIAGANSSAYTTPLQTLAENGSTYTSVVSDGLGRMTVSQPATLTVRPGGFWPAGSMKTSRGGVAALLPNGKVLVVGGTSLPSIAEIYDPTADAFSATGAGIPQDGYTATLLQNGKVLVTGSSSSGVAGRTSATLYDPASGTFSSTAGMTQAFSGLTATLLPSGKVLFIGQPGSASSLQNTEIYDPVSGQFSAYVHSEAAGASSHTATLLSDGRVLIVGGLIAELYDPVAHVFARTGNGVTPGGTTATLLPDGKVLVTGQDSARAQLYDSATGTFTETGSMATAHSSCKATLLPNGKVLIVGGYAGVTALSSAELYDSTVGTFVATGHMGTPRVAPTATLLPNGKVLIAGGFNVLLVTPVANAELYE